MKEFTINKKTAERKFFHAEMKIKSHEGGRFIEGFASTRFKDRGEDIVPPSALASAMDLFMHNPVILLDHNMSHPIGKVVDYKVTMDGLWIKAEIQKGKQVADDAWNDIQFGSRKAFSIGFIPLEISYSDVDDAWKIDKLGLLEISTVTIPANRESLFSIAKAMEKGCNSDLVEVQQTPKLVKVRKQIEILLKVYEAHQSKIDEEEKIYLETMITRLQNILKPSEDRERLEKELELWDQLDQLENEIKSLD